MKNNIKGDVCLRATRLLLTLGGGGEGVLPYKRLLGIAAGKGRTFTTGLTRMGSHICGFFRVRQFLIFTVSKRTRMFVL